MVKIGLDIGSTTLKAVILDGEGKILYKKYKRHFSKITSMTVEMLGEIRQLIPQDEEVSLSVSGSAGMGIADRCSLPFVQEVYATRIAVEKLAGGADCVIELGGEDAKILFLTNESHTASDIEVRMNGSCAGGTGAFIDQMATLLGITPDEMNDYAEKAEKIYSIASRCGVFAKSDIQPLINQGAQIPDISASIFKAVVNQTVAGLAQGRTIGGRVLYLGGPLTFMPQLRKSFDETLGVIGEAPDNSLYFVALGAALSGVTAEQSLDEIICRISEYSSGESYISCPPLFENEEAYRDFTERHSLDRIEIKEIPGYSSDVWIGIDAGSTTVKGVVIGTDNSIILSDYRPNGGNAIPIIRRFLLDFYEKYPDANIRAVTVTGYGEELAKNAFCFDYGVVETIAHFTAAKYFKPDVDFIIDIGGQDIKCFKIHNGAIDNIFLNEACSSGCGSFLQTFAGAWGMSIQELAEKGIHADRPVDLGSRCTVFMNSSVKQAQKDGATIENISAGLSISVVKNALYKVIRTSSADSLGENIVVQGGTFLNDAVLRAFEMETGRNVVRPNISGLMGAYGCALYGKTKSKANALLKSSVLSRADLEAFTHKINAVTCGGCQNNCRLTVNTFSGGRKFIGGNRCERPLVKNGAQRSDKPVINLYEYKREKLASYKPVEGKRGKIGVPMGLNMFELLPFWHTFLTKLGFEVVLSPHSDHNLYVKGQKTISSDTICYPAKLLHGHIDALISEGIDTIFYPCMTFNFDEGLGDNHYNCPVVAYYPEVIHGNVPAVRSIRFIYDYVGIHRPRDFRYKIKDIMCGYYPDITQKEINSACDAAYAEYDAYMKDIRAKGKEYLALARENGMRVCILSGRPYHLDEEINHGIDRLICELGAAVITEDSVSDEVEAFPVGVLNQWTYHSRLYAAAKYVTRCDNDINLIQLVSFGCGVDAITTDEVRSILENAGRIYTQIKIDEITNLGAVKIRLRSLFAALDQAEGK